MRKTIKYFFCLVFFCITVVLVGDGRCGGDEGAVYAFVKAFRSYHYSWSQFAANYELSFYLSHHIFWFFLQSICSLVLDFFSFFVPALRQDLIRDWIMSYLQTFATFFAVVGSYFYSLKKTANKFLSFLIVITIWFGGYGVSFLTGGFLDSFLCVLVILRLYILEDCSQKLDYKTSAKIILVDFTMIGVKVYCLFFCVLSLLVSTFGKVKNKINFFTLYFSVLIPVLCLVFYEKYRIQEQIYNTYSGFMQPLSNLTIIYFLKSLFLGWFSFSYGIIWTFPIVILPLFFNGIRESAIKKIGIISVLLVIFSIFVFWHGSSGIAGNRYIFPFLLFFLPEWVDCFQIIEQKYKKYFLVLPILIVFFLPVLNYRHNLILISGGKTEYYKGSYQESQLPHDNVLIHPALFAWSIQIKKWAGDREASQILPMTFYSRFLYLKQHESEGRFSAYQFYLTSIPNTYFIMIKIFGGMISAIWMALFFVSLKRVTSAR